MGVSTARPSQCLTPFVRSYDLRAARVEQSWVHLPLPARSDCFLEFFLRDPYQIVSATTGAISLSPRAVFVGPHTQRLEDLLYTGHLRVFTIRFTAIGFRALFGIPARLILNRGEPADAVLGSPANELADRLFTCDGSLPALSRIADAFLMQQLLRRPSLSATPHIGSMVRILRKTHGAADIQRLAAWFERSTRQVERDFIEHVGMPPKTFARLERLAYALRLKDAVPGRSWAEIAATAGYSDQTHLGRDFRAMTGETPVRFAAMRSRGTSVWKDHPSSRAVPHSDVAFSLFDLPPASLRSEA